MPGERRGAVNPFRRSLDAFESKQPMPTQPDLANPVTSISTALEPYVDVKRAASYLSVAVKTLNECPHPDGVSCCIRERNQKKSTDSGPVDRHDHSQARVFTTLSPCRRLVQLLFVRSSFLAVIRDLVHS
jgi:hypothetical protein